MKMTIPHKITKALSKINMNIFFIQNIKKTIYKLY